MDIRLKKFLNELTIKDEEINQLVEMFPGLEYADYQNAVKCVKAVVEFGIAISDVSFLIYINPLFMLNDPEDIKETLSAISGDVEETLKSNPYII